MTFMKSPQTQPSRRQFLRGTLAGAAGLAAMPTWSRAAGANGDVRVAVIGFKSRGNGHINSLLKIPGVRLAALCDVDQNVIDKKIADLAKQNISPKTYTDYRECCADPEIDAITIATPNHNHTLIALTAIAAGKHVYVEKPVSHNIWEGQILVDAAAKAAANGKVVQHGMQRRSDIGWASVMEWVKEGHLGAVKLSRGVNYKMRQSIGKVSAPVAPPDSVNYELWSAPRPVLPVMREQFHYDWHWQWAYGNGDIGNQGPHQLDVARWALGNPAALPKRVMSLGGRWGYDDDGETANNQLAFYDYENGAPLLFDNRGMPRSELRWQKGWEPAYKGIRIGNLIHCEGGYVAEAKAYDNDGKTIHKFDDFRDGPDHMLNFIESVRAGKLIKDELHVSHGHHAAALAHMGNVSYRLGAKIKSDEIRERLGGDKAALETFADFVENLQANTIDIDTDKAIAGPWLEFDPKTLRFTGEFAEEANKLTEEEYAKGFELPKIA